VANREIVNKLEQEFAQLIKSLKDLVKSVPADLLYKNSPAVSIGENILRSAAAVEQTCGGLTTNLWDDPFEWTLPETLSTAERIDEYLGEVDVARQRAFNALNEDDALSKYVSSPSGEKRRVISLLVETLVRAAEYQGRARAIMKILSSDKTQGFII
jgi:hypothetical protein